MSTIAGVVTALPALSSGLAEGYALISANGLDLQIPKVRKTVIHALMNDVGVGAAVYQVRVTPLLRSLSFFTCHIFHSKHLCML